MGKRIFIAGIGTEVGKTLCSAIVVEALQADYWKPVQAGDLDNLDSDRVRHHISNPISTIHKETYLMSQPISPHAAARIDGIEIKLSDFKVPETENTLIIEGAGGLMVPLNETGDTILDLIPLISDETILVSRNYLGSINHTLMSIELLKSRNIPIKGILFNGEPNAETEEIILKMSDVLCLAKIPVCRGSLKEFISEYAIRISKALC